MDKEYLEEAAKFHKSIREMSEIEGGKPDRDRIAVLWQNYLLWRIARALEYNPSKSIKEIE